MNQPSRDASAAILRTEHLGRSVDGKAIVSDISLDVRQGEMLGIVGASGSGKSSFLRLLNRLDEPTAGTVLVDGLDYRQIPPRELRRRLGMVTQRPYLFPGTVAANLQYGPRQRGERLADADLARLLNSVGLPDFASRDVANLSGGEQQRVSLARTLANRPEVLLLDEPTAALDEPAKLGIEGLIRDVVRRECLTCLLVSHDREQARRLCDRVAVFAGGKLIETGDPQEVLRA